VLRGDRPECGLDLPVHVKADLVHQGVEALTVEERLDFGKNCLDRVQLWTVAHVVDGLDVQLAPPVTERGGLVDLQLVHEQG